jgi:SnoaL-like domain
MPTRERVRELITMVEAGRYVEAIEAFYAPDATMRENMDPPRGGLEALVANERRALESFTITTRKVDEVLVDGDRAVIHWIFDIVAKDGSHAFVLDELAFQRWSGDHIVEERFFYDPAQRKGVSRAS